MCIALISTTHPAYPLIVLDNRDEFLNRPTAAASWWPSPHSDVLGGRDLLRSEQGTWCGISRDGRIAVLTNYREDVTPAARAVSRGALTRSFLTDSRGLSTESFVKDVLASGAARDAGGFSLVCGKVGEPLAVISNRARAEDDIPWIAGDERQIVGLSNAAYGDRSWPKVTEGEALLQKALQDSLAAAESEDELVARLLELLSVDSLPRSENQGGLETYIRELRKTILVPPLGRRNVSSLPPDEVAAAKKEEVAQVTDPASSGASQGKLGMSGVYGTQKQTVILVSRSDKVRFFERTLFDADANSVPLGEGDLNFEFEIKR